MGKILTDKRNKWRVPTVYGGSELQVGELIRMLGSTIPDRPKEKADWSTLTAFLYMYVTFIIGYVVSLLVDAALKGGW